MTRQAIEARQGGNGAAGSVHESAVPAGDAARTNPEPPMTQDPTIEARELLTTERKKLTRDEVNNSGLVESLAAIRAITAALVRPQPAAEAVARVIEPGILDPESMFYSAADWERRRAEALAKADALLAMLSSAPAPASDAVPAGSVGVPAGLVGRLQDLRERALSALNGWRLHDSCFFAWLAEHMGPANIEYLRFLWLNGERLAALSPAPSPDAAAIERRV